MDNVDPLIFSRGPVVIFRWRNAPHWPVVSVTPNVNGVLGYSAEELLQNRFHYDTLIHPNDRPRVTEELARFSRSGDNHFRLEPYRVLSKDGTVVWLEQHSYIERNSEREITHYGGYVIDITTRKIAELERLAMLNAIPDLMFTVNQDGVFLDYHAHDADDLAMPPQAFLGKCMLDVIPGPLGREGMMHLQRALATNGVSTHEYTMLTQGGDSRDFEARYSAKGKDEALVIVRDITEIKQAQTNLRNRDAQLRLLTDQVKAVFWTMDTEMRFTMMRGAGLKRLRLAEDQLVGTSLPEYLSIDNADFPPIKNIASALEGESVSFDFTWKGVVYQSYVEPWHDEHGRIVGAIGISLDITERKQTEQRLSTSETRFKDIAESMSDWIWEVDNQGVYTYCSERVQDILGYRAEEIIGKTPFDFMRPDETERVRREFAAFCADKAPIKNLENWNLTKQGRSVCLLTNGIPLFDEMGNLQGYRGVDSDITERKMTEQALIQAKEEAEIASQAKSQFMSRMSHELRTPLNAILGFTELLLDGDAEDGLSDSQRTSLNTVHQAGRHLLNLINEVLDLAKIEAGTMKLAQVPVDWLTEVSQCVELTMPLADKNGIGLSFQYDDSMPETVFADPMRFKQVLLNLLSNAVKYNRKGGQVTVCATRGDHSRLRIEVHDTGAGLTEDQIENLFQPFNRLAAEHSELEGVGIGLVISKHLIELMDGTIGVSSTVGKGSVFWLELACVANSHVA